jgi:hypothetical protein
MPKRHSVADRPFGGPRTRGSPRECGVIQVCMTANLVVDDDDDDDEGRSKSSRNDLLPLFSQGTLNGTSLV